MSLQTILKTRREGDVMTCWGRVIHTRDTATGNDRSPTVVTRKASSTNERRELTVTSVSASKHGVCYRKIVIYDPNKLERS